MQVDKKVFISTTSFAEFDNAPLDLLTEKGYSYSLNPYRRKMNAGEIIDLAKEAVGIVAGTERLDDSVFQKLSKLKVISRCGSGMDNVDGAAALRKGIEVCNTPDGPTLAVAELTLGLVLNLLRKINKMDESLRQGDWSKIMGNLLCGKKIGIIGFGRIGQKTAQLIAGFDVAEIAYYDIEEKECVNLKCERKSLEALLKEADIVTLHVPSSGKNGALIGEKELSLMKKGSWIINVSRGGVVDESALYVHLKNGHLSGAAVDVFDNEPYSGPLKELDNVILTPHIGSYAKESRVKMEMDSVKNLLDALGGK
ncbi:MAG: phosphoglycerate dehydrogenase [Candidatus Omnitrophica bacterium]|nr:phosphoglycerate dehydrogenase [Candidatus Omnitrophota bacterium]